MNITYYSPDGRMIWTSKIVHIFQLDQAWVAATLQKSNAKLIRWDLQSMTGVFELGPLGGLVVLSKGPPKFGKHSRQVLKLIDRLLNDFEEIKHE